MDSQFSMAGGHSRNHYEIRSFDDNNAENHSFECSGVIEKRIDLERDGPFDEIRSYWSSDFRRKY